MNRPSVEVSGIRKETWERKLISIRKTVRRKILEFYTGIN
jgi:hypothetical protein